MNGTQLSLINKIKESEKKNMSKKLIEKIFYELEANGPASANTVANNLAHPEGKVSAVLRRANHVIPEYLIKRYNKYGLTIPAETALEQHKLILAEVNKDNLNKGRETYRNAMKHIPPKQTKHRGRKIVTVGKMHPNISTPAIILNDNGTFEINIKITGIVK